MYNSSKLMLAAAMAVAMTACSDKNDEPEIEINFDGGAIEITADNLSNWTRYASQVAVLLEKDADNLLKSWEQSYEGGRPFAEIFKQHTSGAYSSSDNCIEQIIDGCSDIANEVGTAKIGDPLELLLQGHPQQALFAVESWFSWHSREDYANNIISIRNSYYGSLDGQIASASMSNLVASIDSDLDRSVKEKIALAQTAIMAIPAPFRNNINSTETATAMTACANLEQTLESLKGFFASLQGHEAEKQAIVENYVDAVVLPTYRSLAAETAALRSAVNAMALNPSDATFAAAAEAWFAARVPWEQSEAFLFGPVDALGLDPNMDSWPLDQTAIANHLTSGDLSDLDITEGGLVTEASQNVRGFHTLEFLLFKDGAPRTVDHL